MRIIDFAVAGGVLSFNKFNYFSLLVNNINMKSLIEVKKLKHSLNIYFIY
jgi:hypothetical protein